jgi:NTE family protein
VDNLPIDLVRRMGADVIIAVDISTPPIGRDELYSVLAITTQLATLSSDQNKSRQVGSLAGADVFIRPDLGSITVASFERATDAVGIGSRAARAALARLEPLALGPEEYRAWQAARAAWAASRRPPVISALRIVNRSRLADQVIAARIDAPLGRPLDVRRLEVGLDQIYGLELFESVYYDVEPGPEGNVLTVTARERAWGPNYLQGGVAVFEDFEGPNFNVALAYSRTAINGRNGEWRSGIQVGREPRAWTELYQPLDVGLRTFLELDLFAGERALSEFDREGHKRMELGLTRFGGALAAGHELGTGGELRAGVLRAGGGIRVQVGDPGLPARRYDTGEAFAQIRLDRLDAVAFPHRGGAMRAGFAAGLEPLGSSVGYQQAVVDGALFGTRRSWTGMVGAAAATTLQSDAPFESRFRLGGLGQLSGLEQDEIEGQHAMLARAGLYRRIGNLQLLPVYAGMLAEYGNVYPTRSRIELADGIAAGSFVLGVDTMIGPLCAAYGRAEGGRDNYYLTLGPPPTGLRPGLWSR